MLKEQLIIKNLMHFMARSIWKFIILILLWYDSSNAVLVANFELSDFMLAMWLKLHTVILKIVFIYTTDNQHHDKKNRSIKWIRKIFYKTVVKENF